MTLTILISKVKWHYIHFFFVYIFIMSIYIYWLEEYIESSRVFSRQVFMLLLQKINVIFFFNALSHQSFFFFFFFLQQTKINNHVLSCKYLHTYITLHTLHTKMYTIHIYMEKFLEPPSYMILKIIKKKTPVCYLWE